MNTTLLKTTPKQRIEFRKMVRDVAAKSHDHDEFQTKTLPYAKANPIDWPSELRILTDYVWDLFKKAAPKVGPALVTEKLAFMEAFVRGNALDMGVDLTTEQLKELIESNLKKGRRDQD